MTAEEELMSAVRSLEADLTKAVRDFLRAEGAFLMAETDRQEALAGAFRYGWKAAMSRVLRNFDQGES
jgi:hypothetical protein